MAEACSGLRPWLHLRLNWTLVDDATFEAFAKGLQAHCYDVFIAVTLAQGAAALWKMHHWWSGLKPSDMAVPCEVSVAGACLERRRLQNLAQNWLERGARLVRGLLLGQRADKVSPQSCHARAVPTKH
eukprot:5053350-Amphidinium_carterae.1